MDHTPPHDDVPMSAEAFGDELQAQARKLALLGAQLHVTAKRVTFHSRTISQLQHDVAELENQIQPFDSDDIKSLERMINDKKFWKRVRRTGSYYFFGVLGVIVAVWAAREPLKVFYDVIKGVLP